MSRLLTNKFFFYIFRLRAQNFSLENIDNPVRCSPEAEGATQVILKYSERRSINTEWNQAGRPKKYSTMG